MTKEQAFQVIKQTLDACVKAGIPQTLEQAAIIAQAWSIIIKEIENSPKQV